ncbi:SpoIIE family protein phosphatase [Streptomyces chengbuensis]|uniref:ATP-binding SpoIIE family protein phosphatase n=1 Tax=Streptomyces TaxID=1883 RepID=UPI0025B59576|nr:SpoIIE family protein phosphatase [Streptomyces sp. HUAS CB01]WJY48937.1 SpoIIE family protein phosphatase [Streptomyces sp. HUAS CB01]
MWPPAGPGGPGERPARVDDSRAGAAGTGRDDSPFAVAGTAAALLDGAGTVVALTPAAEALLGRPCADVCGRSVRELLADADSWETLRARWGGGRAPAGASGGAGASGVSEASGGAGARDADRGERGAPDPQAGWEGRVTLRHGSGHELDVGFGVLPLDEGRGDGAARFLVVCAPEDVLVRWRQDRALTRELFLQGRVGLALFDAGLRLLRTNSHLLPYTGVPFDMGGRRLGDFLRAEDAETIDAQLREVLRTGHPLIGFSTTVRTLVDPRGGRELSFSAFRLLESDGRAMGVATVFTDVTDHQRARGRLELLYRATEALSGSSLSVMRTVEDLAGVLAPALGDRAAVDLAETVLTGGEPPADGRHALVLLRMAVAGAEAGVPRTGTTHAETVDEPDGRGPGAFAGNSHGVLVTGLGRDAQAAPGGAPEWAAAVPEAHSAMAAPLRARGIMFGRLVVWRTGHRPALDLDDLALLEEIASRAALAVDNARRYTKERRTAVGLQRSLLPPATCERPALEAAGAYLPADADSGVGGDWFDVIPLSSARVALVVGDVAGHGLHATAMMGRLRSAVRALADLDLEPEELLAHLDDLVLQVAAEAESEEPGNGDTGIPLPGGPAGATCLYAVYDPVARQCVMASAGHPPPAVVTPDGTVDWVDLSPGPPLGVGGWPFEAAERDLTPGSVLALYTDGLIERGEGDIDEGMRDLADRLVRAAVLERPLRHARHDIVEDLPPGRLKDDVTLLLARTREVPADSTATWLLDADPAVVADARHLVLEQLTRWDLDELGFTTELIASELVTNAIRYAGGPVRLRLLRTDALTCEVSDPSNTQPRMRRARTSEEGGRGLYLVAQLSRRWGSRYTREGKTVWSEQSLPLVLTGRTP